MSVAMQLDLFTKSARPGEGTHVYFGSESAREKQQPLRVTRALSQHSLDAKDNNQEAHKNRKGLILDCLRLRNKGMTARQILEDLFPGREDMNLVRPRISDLLREGKLMELGEAFDHRTGETVSVFWIK